MTFILIVKIVLLITVLFLSVCSVGVKEQDTGDRCMMLVITLTAALVILTLFDHVY